MGTILDNEKKLYSLRKLSVGLISVMIGTGFYKSTNKEEVKADATDDSYLEQEASSNLEQKQFDIFGKIIPVDENNRIIVEAPQISYQRSSQDFNQAIPTPAPKFKGYLIASTNPNYDQATNLVTPPLDSSQSTRLVYQKKTAELSTPIEDSRQEKAANNESVAKDTRLFGFGKKKKETAPVSSDQQSEQTTEEPSKTQPSANLSEQKSDPQKIAQEKTEKKDQAKQAKADKAPAQTSKTSAAEHKQKSNKKKSKKPKNQEKESDFSPVILNKETKIPPKPLTATIEINDEVTKENITSLTCQGQPGQAIVFDNLKQVVEIYRYSGYHFDEIKNVTEDQVIKIDDLDQINLGKFKDRDVDFVLYLKHQLAKADRKNSYQINPKEFTFLTKLTVHFQGQDLPDKVQEVRWNRTRTIDLVTKALVKGKYDTNFKPEEVSYQKVVAPKINGYLATPSEIEPLKVVDYDLEKTISYQKDPDQPTAEDYEKQSTLTVVFKGAGAKTPEAVKQTATWTRSLKLLDDGQLENTPWQTNLEDYEPVKVPVVDGYHADQAQINQLKVTQDDIQKIVTYEKNGALILTDDQGKQLDQLPYQTDPDDAAKIVEIKKLPVLPDYQTPEVPVIKDPSQDQKVVYQPKEKFTLVDSAHPHSQVDPEEYEKTVKFIVNFEGAGDETPKPVVQKIKLLRKLTFDDQKQKIVPGKYTTDWDSAGKIFKSITVPIIDGYQASEKVVAAPSKLIDREVTVSYQRQVQVGEIKFVQVIHFVDENGQKLAADQIERVYFSHKNGEWSQKIASFKNLEAPVITGYYTDHKMITGKSVMPDEKQRQVEITVVYHKFGQIIPINQAGEIIKDGDQDAVKVFENDPLDATRALMDQAVPEIAGFTPARKTVSPEDMAINIPVLYQEE